MVTFVALSGGGRPWAGGKSRGVVLVNSGVGGVLLVDSSDEVVILVDSGGEGKKVSGGQVESLPHKVTSARCTQLDPGGRLNLNSNIEPLISCVLHTLTSL